MYDIEKELALYRLREIENEDMRLKIEELEIGEQLGSSGFEERVQTSMKCKNNDFIMEQIETLKKKIRLNELGNKRVDNALKILKDKDDLEVINRVLIDKKSIARTSQELFRSRKSVRNSLERALGELKKHTKGNSKGTTKVS